MRGFRVAVEALGYVVVLAAGVPTKLLCPFFWGGFGMSERTNHRGQKGRVGLTTARLG